MIYEMRRYEATPGKMAALNEVMESLAVPVFEKVGMRLVGAWTPVAGDYTNALSYMLAWESLNEREEKWQDFFNHPIGSPDAKMSARSTARSSPGSSTHSSARPPTRP